MDNYYDWIKVGHIISMTAWMAGMFYLPRLFAYHADKKNNTQMNERFCIMEKRLLRVIMNPAMILTVVFGLMLINIYGISNVGSWFHIKMLIVTMMIAVHGILAKHRRSFETKNNTRSSTYFKILNETITVMFIVLVIMVVVKPFDD